MHRLYPPPATDLPAEQAFAAPAGPFLRANMVASVDGAAYLQGRTGGLSGAADRELFATLRAMCEVILVGAGTVNAELYGPAHLSAGGRALRASRGLADPPPIAVVSARLALDFESELFTDPAARPFVVTSAAAPPERLATARNVAEVIVAGRETIDFAAAVAQLTARGMNHVLCEGGPVLLAHLFGAGLVDELCLTVSPLLVAGAARRILDGVLDAPRRLQLTEVYAADGYLFTRYAPGSP